MLQRACVWWRNWWIIDGRDQTILPPWLRSITGVQHCDAGEYGHNAGTDLVEITAMPGISSMSQPGGGERAVVSGRDDGSEQDCAGAWFRYRQ